MVCCAPTINPKEGSSWLTRISVKSGCSLATTLPWAGPCATARSCRISQYTALFAILGTTYGGNGQTTFGLPDLRGRAPVHMGSGPGLTPRRLGENGGAEKITLTTAQMPAHNHMVNANASETGSNNPSGAVPGLAMDGTNENPVNVYSGTGAATMSPQMIAPAGQGQPHDNLQPFLTMNFIIALEGEFPPRS